MSHYLQHLAARAVGTATVAQPRLPSLFGEAPAPPIERRNRPDAAAADDAESPAEAAGPAASPGARTLEPAVRRGSHAAPPASAASTGRAPEAPLPATARSGADLAANEPRPRAEGVVPDAPAPRSHAAPFAASHSPTANLRPGPPGAPRGDDGAATASTTLHPGGRATSRAVDGPARALATEPRDPGPSAQADRPTDRVGASPEPLARAVERSAAPVGSTPASTGAAVRSTDDGGDPSIGLARPPSRRTMAAAGAVGERPTTDAPPMRPVPPRPEVTATAPTVQVTIGRLEVRAAAGPTLPQRATRPAAAAPTSLEQYLHRRGRGGTA